jgi:hypothetical protein
MCACKHGVLGVAQVLLNAGCSRQDITQAYNLVAVREGRQDLAAVLRRALDWDTGENLKMDVSCAPSSPQLHPPEIATEDS